MELRVLEYQVFSKASEKFIMKISEPLQTV